MKSKKIILAIILISITVTVLPLAAHADSDVPVDIDIRIYDLPADCTIDILIKDESLNNTNFIDDNHTNEQIRNYAEDGYYALGARQDSYYYLRYSYFEITPYYSLKMNLYDILPNDFKIIICTSEGNIIVSEAIDYYVNAEYDYDYSNNGLTSSKNKRPLNRYLLLFLSIACITALTIIIGLIVARIMKIKKYLIIFLTNLFISPILSICMSFLFTLTLSIMAIITTIVLKIIAEYFIYKFAFKKEYPTKRILLYTIIANFASYFLIQLFLFLILIFFITTKSFI